MCEVAGSLVVPCSLILSFFDVEARRLNVVILSPYPQLPPIRIEQ